MAFAFHYKVSVLGQLALGLTGFTSVCASVCILFWLSRITRGHRHKLMARQLWHLALADLCGSFVIASGAVLTLVLVWSELQLSRPLQHSACLYVSLQNIFAMTSILVEIHIALTTALAIRRCNRFVAALSGALTFLWPLGFAVGMCVVIMDRDGWDDSIGACSYSRNYGEYLKSGVLILGVIICGSTYIYAALLSVSMDYSSNMAATVRLWSRAKYYTLMSLIANGPFCAWNLLEHFGFWSQTPLSSISTAAWYVSIAVFNLHGLFNTVVYAAHCRYVRQVMNFRQDFSLASSRASAAMSLQQCTHAPQPIAAASFTVRFSEPEVTEVANIQAEAQATANQDLVMLLLSQGKLHIQDLEAARTHALQQGHAGDTCQNNGKLEEAMYAEVLGCFDEAESIMPSSIIDANVEEFSFSQRWEKAKQEISNRFPA